MPVISHRGALMPPSPIRKLVPFAEAAKSRGTKVYHLNIGQPDIETPPAILNAVKHADIKVLEYSHSAGYESYRRKLVEYYGRNGINVNHNQIIVTTGGSEAIAFAIQACMDPGDEIIIPNPSTPITTASALLPASASCQFLLPLRMASPFRR